MTGPVVTVSALLRVWEPTQIKATVTVTRRPESGELLGWLTLHLGDDIPGGSVQIVVDGPDVADHLSTALMWAGHQLETLLDAGQTGDAERFFGPDATEVTP